MTLAYTSPFQTFPHLYLPSIIHTHSYYIMLPSNHLLVWAKSYNTISWEICCISKLRFLASFKHSLGWFQVGITDQPPTWRTKNHLRKSNPRIFEDLSNPAPLAGPNPQSPRRWWSCDEAGRLSPQKSEKKNSKIGGKGFGSWVCSVLQVFFSSFFWVIANDGGANKSSPGGLVGSFSSFSEKKTFSVMRQKSWRIGKKDGKLQGLVLQSRKPLGSSCDSYIPLTRVSTSTIYGVILDFSQQQWRLNLRAPN